MQQGVWDSLSLGNWGTSDHTAPQEHSLAAPFVSRASVAKSRWWKGNRASKKEAKKAGLFIASKISFTTKRSLKQKYQLAGWHPQPEFSFNHMVA